MVLLGLLIDEARPASSKTVPETILEYKQYCDIWMEMTTRYKIEYFAEHTFIENLYAAGIGTKLCQIL